MSEDIEIQRKMVRTSHILRSAFWAVFQQQGDQAALVIATIAERCGANATEKADIDPSLISFWNWFRSMLGVGGEINLNLTSPKAFQDYIQEAKALLSVASMNDIQQELAQIGGEDGKGS